MNAKAPVEETKDEGSGKDQKVRHFKNYDLLKQSFQDDEYMARPEGTGG